MNLSYKKLFCIIMALSALLSSCAGEDYTPVYFPPEAPEDQGPSPTASPAGGRQCTLSFTSQLCVEIKGENVDVGTTQGDSLCAEVGAFPIHIQGSKVSIKGSEFPDIKAEGHGLPAPITINAKGNGDGEGNVGEGAIDSAGNINIENFSLFIVALGVVGEIPNLKLTTLSTDELENLPSVTGAPPDASGAMTLVTAATLGHTIDAADKYLMGASLTAAFAGSINPSLSECGGEGERSIEVKKLIVDENGGQTEVPIPEGKTMEVSTGTYMAEGPPDIGGRFETKAVFRVRNVGNKPLSIAIPPRIGPFFLSAIDPLTRTLSPQQTFILNATFKPTSADKEGKITQPISMGTDQFILSGVALSKSGRGAINIVDETGAVSKPDVGSVDVGLAVVSANTERAFFKCAKIDCNDSKSWTNCGECKDPTTEPCELLPVSTAGRPMGEVDGACKILDPNAAPLYTIDLRGSGNIELGGHKQVLALRNTGASPMQITGLSIEEVPDSKSTGQFSIPNNAIFVAKSFEEVRQLVTNALEGGTAKGQALPVTLPPYAPKFDTTAVYVVVTYSPSDLKGSDGTQAGVGSAARDRAIVKIATSAGEITTEVTGETTIRETPALELYFKTSTGTKQIADSGAFPFRGVTAETLDLAVPLFLRVAGTASASLRVTSISIDGTDSANFRWLDTAEKISSVQPPSGKGMRCSIPVIDETTNEMTSESFDLKPVSLAPPGFDLAPGAYSTQTMPLFGCVDFHRDEASPATRRLFEARLTVTAGELSASGTPARNPDGSYKQTTLTAKLLASINPKSGRMVMRITQTMSAILNPQFPGLSSVSSRQDAMREIQAGQMTESDLAVLTASLILDPFDEMTIMTSEGSEIASRPNDGVTAVFRAIDTHPVDKNYSEDGFFDYAGLIFDSSLSAGHKGIFEDYPNVPENAKANAWRIFTASLSYPGPLADPAKRPSAPSSCEVINPCSAEGQRKFTDAGVAEGSKGACAFFYTSGGRFDSPAFHKQEEGGEYAGLCAKVGESQNLKDANTGSYTVDGSISVEEVGLRLFGPTFFHNPGGPLGPKPPLDEVFHMGFTTGILKPQKNPNEVNVLPDEKINLAKNEFKINLDDRSVDIPPICPSGTKNRVANGRPYSTWRFLEGLLFKDEEGAIPVGCPDDGNNFTGGVAYLSGRKLDQETGVVTFVAAAKFGSSDDLSFALKDVMIFMVLNGWLCDPAGRPEDFEGARCYDLHFNDRDAVGQISIIR